MNCITSTTPTLCRILDVEAPALAAAEPLAGVVEAASAAFDGGYAEKCLMYAPDAIGLGLYREHAAPFEPVRTRAPLEVPLRSVYPPTTPVCFASMFTGAPPEAHGIRTYEKPVLRGDTLFDALLRAGKRLAIVAVADSSLDRIFRERDLDYFSESYDPAVTERTLALLEAGKHDFILAYHQEYDDVLHATSPRSPAALRAMEKHVRSFGTLAEAAARHWDQYALAFTPDHGAHVDAATGRGAHGDDVDEDMNVVHLYGFYRGERLRG